MNRESVREVSVWIDGSHRIVAVNAAWDEFAQSNGGESVSGDRVVGSDLLSWIRGDETRMMLSALLQFVRLTGQSVSRQYRCDSPDLRRLMRMNVLEERSGLIRFDHELLHTEQMRPTMRFFPAGHSGGETVRRCSFCNRVEISNAWWNGDEAARDGRLSADRVVAVVYVVCPLCVHEQGIRAPNLPVHSPPSRPRKPDR